MEVESSDYWSNYQCFTDYPNVTDFFHTNSISHTCAWDALRRNREECDETHFLVITPLEFVDYVLFIILASITANIICCINPLILLFRWLILLCNKSKASDSIDQNNNQQYSQNNRDIELENTENPDRTNSIE